MLRASLCVTMILLGCKEQPTIQPYYGEATAVRELCGARLARAPLTRFGAIQFGSFELIAITPLPCAGDQEQALRLQGDAEAYKGVAVVDGYFGNENPEIAADVQAIRNSYERQGFLVVDTSNQSADGIQQSVGQAREAHPTLFDGSKPFHNFIVSHGARGEGGLDVAAKDTRIPGGKVQYPAEDRAAAAIRGAGPDVDSDIFVSSCLSGRFSCDRGTLKEVNGQVNSVTTSSRPNELSWQMGRHEQFAQKFIDAQTRPEAFDANRDGQVNVSEVYQGELLPGRMTVHSAYVDNQWHADSKIITDVDHHPSAARRGTVDYQGRRYHTFHQAYDYPQHPVTQGNDAVIAFVPQEAAPKND